MSTAVLIALILAAPTAPASRPDGQSRELSDGEVRSQLDAFLGSIDTPIRAEQWRSLGARAAPILEQIAQDHDRLPTRRARAIDGLAHVGGKPSFFAALAQNESEPPVVRMSAVRGAGRVMGPHKLVAALKPVLTFAKDSHVRAAAAEVLAHRAPSAGCAQVAEQLARESADHRAAFHRATKACNLDSLKSAE